MHKSGTSDLAKQDSVGNIALTDIDIKCVKAPAKEVGDEAASETVDVKNHNQLVKVS
jgi:hypothetical protein